MNAASYAAGAPDLSRPIDDMDAGFAQAPALKSATVAASVSASDFLESDPEDPSSAMVISDDMRRTLSAIVWGSPGLRFKRRKFIEAVLIVALDMRYWKMIPPDYGNFHAIYVRFTRWVRNGNWGPVIAALEGTECGRALEILVAGYQDSWERRKILSVYRRRSRVTPAMRPPANERSG